MSSTNQHGGAWRRREDNGIGQPIPFETCDYCGSVTPEDFVKFLEAGYRCEVADWKYGFPHKVYIDVPNPKPDEPRVCGSTSTGSRTWHHHENGRVVGHVKTQETAPPGFPEWSEESGWHYKQPYPMLHLKFYTEHLADLPELEKHAALIEKCTSVRFTRDAAGRIMWQATPRGRHDGA